MVLVPCKMMVCFRMLLRSEAAAAGGCSALGRCVLRGLDAKSSPTSSSSDDEKSDAEWMRDFWRKCRKDAIRLLKRFAVDALGGGVGCWSGVVESGSKMQEEHIISAWNRITAEKQHPILSACIPIDAKFRIHASTSSCLLPRSYLERLSLHSILLPCHLAIELCSFKPLSHSPSAFVGRIFLLVAQNQGLRV